MERLDLIEVLARLDLLVAGPKLWSLTDSNTEEHVQRVLIVLSSKLGNRYRVRRIRDLLWQKFCQGDKFPKHNFPRLFLHGSGEMLSLDSHERKMIKERIEVIKNWRESEKPESRQLRSVPPQAEERSRASSRVSSTPARSTPRQRSTPRSPTRDRYGKFARKPLHQRRSALAQTRHRANPPSREQTLPPVAVVIKSVESEGIPSSSRSSPRSARRLAPSTPISTRKLSPVSLRDNSEDVLNGAIDGGSSEWVQNSYRRTESTHEMEELLSELTHYQKLYNKARHDIADMEHMNAQVNIFNRQTKGVAAKMLVELKKTAQENNILQGRVNSLRDLDVHFGIGDSDDEIPKSTPQLHPHFSTLKDTLRRIQDINNTKLAIDSLYGRCDDLDTLLSSIFDFHGPKHAINPLNAHPAMTFDDLVKALIGAAVHRWVFGSKYHPVSMKETPILQKYRDHLVTICGPDRLYKFDRAVHQSMIEDPQFQKATIPRTAERYRDRLLNALQLLPGAQNYPMRKRLQDSILDAFVSAFKIRSLSLLSTETYRVIWPSSGSTFNNKTMEPRYPLARSRENTIRFTLCPGLIAYPRAKGMVGYDAFENAEATSNPTDDLIKCVVVL